MKKVKWNLKIISEGFRKFFDEHKRYPTSIEIDTYEHLPSSRQIQRQFGGLPALRAKLKLGGPTDFTKGDYSSERARMISRRAHSLEKEVYEYLIGCFGKPFVHREYFFSDDQRTRTDFFIYYNKGNFSVDVFYPKDRHNLIGCLNSKMKTYSNDLLIQYPVIFLMMNDEISREQITSILSKKKRKLHSYLKVMTMQELKEYCKGKLPMQAD